jgi:hypothetical protein
MDARIMKRRESVLIPSEREGGWGYVGGEGEGSRGIEGEGSRDMG